MAGGANAGMLERCLAPAVRVAGRLRIAGRVSVPPAVVLVGVALGGRALPVLAGTAALALYLGAAVSRSITEPVRQMSAVLGSAQTDGPGAVARVAASGAGEGGELGRLGVAIDGLLDAAVDRADAGRRDQEAREEQLRRGFAEQRTAAKEVRGRARVVIDETIRSILDDLDGVIGEVEVVRHAAGTIDAGVSIADSVTRDVVDRAAEADRVIDAFAASLRDVAGVAAMIRVVADKTNLLALNAAIEAARAGEAGRGFAVVADEVKSLARTTAESTGRIASTIAQLEQDAAAVAGAIAGMAQGIGGIDGATAELSAVADRQHATVETLAQRVRETMGRVEGMTKLADRLELRRFERVAYRSPATLRAAGGDRTVQLVDLSEGGARCQVPVATGLHEGGLVELAFPVRGESFRMQAMLLELRADGDAVFDFSPAPDAERTRLGAQLEVLRAATD